MTETGKPEARDSGEIGAAAAGAGLTSGLVLIMAAASGVFVANIYYNQPILADIARTFGATPAAVNLVPTLTQAGYAIGLLLLAPLGDRFDRRKLILIQLVLLCLSLVAAALSPTLAVLCAASLAVGVTATIVQQLVPFAAQLAPAESRGRIVGTVMSGLLLGILLGRAVSGTIAAHGGWRAVFWAAAALSAGAGAVLAARLPSSKPTTEMSYPALLGSLWRLLRTQPALREASAEGALLFAAFSAFWSTLVLLLESDAYRLGSEAAGLFGIVGAVGALAAPVVGRLADRGGPRRVIGAAILCVALSFAIFGGFGTSMAGLVLGVILLDLGVQAAQVSNQTRIYAMLPKARSRLNTVYMTIYFLGGSAGSAAAAIAWKWDGWTGVSLLGFALAAAALAVHAAGGSRSLAGRDDRIPVVRRS
jgi:predicted MFS family arabinose efflux permease